jgi:uncharacterized protein YggE
MFSQIVKKYGLVILIVFVCLMPNSPIAEETEKDRLITVEGNATARVKPQLVQATLELYTVENTTGKAYDKIVKESNQLIQTLNQLELKEEDFKNDFSLGEVTYPERTGEYWAQNYRKIILRDFSLLGYLLDLVTDKKVSDVDFYFDIANRDSIYLEVLKKAVKDAKNKAQALSERSGLRLGELVSLREGHYGVYPRDILGGLGRVSGGMKVTSPEEGTY